MLEVQIFTLYPDLFPGLLDVGIYKKAKEKQKWSLKIIDIRDYAFDDNRTVDDTPFGQGKPFSSGQLETQLRLHGFLPEKHFSALYMLPSKKRNLQRFSPFLEKIGQKLPFLVGGLIMLEASKIPDVTKGSPILDSKRSPRGVLEGLAKGKPQPVLNINNKKKNF